jgi:protein-S-isoprenylcysteine O-methyltransferase Ste14
MSGLAHAPPSGAVAVRYSGYGVDNPGGFFMADAAKPSWIVRIPTPIWLILLVIVALVADLLFTLPVLVQYKPAGIALIVLGFAFSGWGRLTFRNHGAEIFPWSEAHSTLVAAGPFRFTRNPMYLGIAVIGLGAALLAGTWLMWIVPIAIFALDNFLIIPFEERSMERACGDAYRAYKARVRRWI